MLHNSVVYSSSSLPVSELAWGFVMYAPAEVVAPAGIPDTSMTLKTVTCYVEQRVTPESGAVSLLE